MQVAAERSVPLTLPETLADRFPSLLNALGPFAPAPHLAIALSGGADSLALTLLADRWAHTQGGRITALTIDHRLRLESTEEAQRVAEQMRAYGIAHHILTPAHDTASKNLQESARLRRYKALTDWCCAHDVRECVLAHHAGDQRETIGLHTARGDTADGSSGMAAVRNECGIRLLRPLLTIEKSELTDWLRAQGISWIEDPSNQNPRFARVALRHALAQDLQETAALAAHAEHAGADRAAREEALARAALTCVTLHPAGYAELKAEPWAALEPTQATELLANILTTVSGAVHRPRSSDTVRLAAALRTASTQRTLHGCEITQRHGLIRITREYARVASPLELAGTGSACWDGRFTVHYALPAGLTLTLAALGTLNALARPAGIPRATPAIMHLDRLLFIPHITAAPPTLPDDARISIGFAPAKPLAAAPFWWLNR